MARRANWPPERANRQISQLIEHHQVEPRELFRQRPALADPGLLFETRHHHAFETGSDLRAGLGRWITYYNTQRPHSGLDGRTPVEAIGGTG